MPYVASLPARGVIECNRQPAPLRFTALSKPQMYGVDKTAAERAQRAAALFGPAVGVGGGLAFRLAGGASLSTELAPMLQLIAFPAAAAAAASRRSSPPRSSSCVRELNGYPVAGARPRRAAAAGRRRDAAAAAAPAVARRSADRRRHRGGGRHLSRLLALK